MTKKNLITGIIAGAAAGAIIGYLFATESGAALRKKIAEKGTDLGDIFKEKISELGDVVKDELSSIVSSAGGIIEKKVKNGSEMAEETAEKWTN